jgi:Family of unknown function (DUF5677)
MQGPAMGKSPSKTARSTNRQLFSGLKPYMTGVARGRCGRHGLYSLCIRASISKCFEFNLAVTHLSKLKISFFALASLRGICEDLIVLRFIGRMPTDDRQAVLAALMSHEIATRTKLQDAFFSAIRPQQPVLRLQDADAQIARAEAAARDVWKRNGWPNFNKGPMPPVRQIAEKQGLHQLSVLYDYFYRLTSAGVHFNVQSLLRSGWGDLEKAVVFSPTNFHEYFKRFCALYGAFMYCLYFEFFRDVLRPETHVREIVGKIRENVLMAPRWPEMITYEEMNLRPPEHGETLRVVASALQAVSRKRLISKGVNYQNERSAERRLMKRLLGIIGDGMRQRPQAVDSE